MNKKDISSNERKKSNDQNAVSLFEQVRHKIILLRDCQVILDTDIAGLYGVETKRINEAVKNNLDKFPEGYMFRLTNEEVNNLRSKFRPQISGLNLVYSQLLSWKKGCIC